MLGREMLGVLPAPAYSTAASSTSSELAMEFISPQLGIRGGQSRFGLRCREASMVSSLIGAPGIEKTSMAFRRKLVQVAGELGMEPDALATIISFESAGSFNPAIRNQTSGCVGLIQFCKQAGSMVAQEAGTPMSGEQANAWLGAMTAEEQLEHVASYFKLVGKGRKPLSLTQAYLLVFAPAFAFSDPSQTAYAAGTAAYSQNRPMDLDGDGRITVGDISRKIVSHYATGESRPRVPVEGASFATASAFGGNLGVVAFVGIGAALGWYVLSDYVEEATG